MSKQTNNLKSDFDQLDKLVTQIESGSLSLDESIEIYKKALSIAKKLKIKLDSFEKEVAVLQTEFEEIIEGINE